MFERTGPKAFRLTVSEALHIDKAKKELMILEGSYKELIAPIRKPCSVFLTGHATGALAVEFQQGRYKGASEGLVRLKGKFNAVAKRC